MELYEKYKSLFNRYQIITKLRISHFMAQIDHESHLKAIEENLNYSKEGLLKIFSKYFNSTSAELYKRNPEKIANKVYANRMGNGDEKSGDGWKYRGRGFIQLTGKKNYELLSKDTGIDFLNNPNLLLIEANAMLAALWFWKRNNISIFADRDDIISVTKLINGGLNGIEDRKLLLIKYKKLIKDDITL